MLKIIRKSESGEDRAINVNCCDTAGFSTQNNSCHFVTRGKRRCFHAANTSSLLLAHRELGGRRFNREALNHPLSFHRSSQSAKKLTVGTGVVSFV